MSFMFFVNKMNVVDNEIYTSTNQFLFISIFAFVTIKQHVMWKQVQKFIL